MPLLYRITLLSDKDRNAKAVRCATGRHDMCSPIGLARKTILLT